MQQLTEVRQQVADGELDEKLIPLLCGDNTKLDAYRTRLLHAIDAFADKFGEDREIALFSAPGRTELGGNHTDHQRGHVLAGAINLDMIAVVARRQDTLIQVQSKGYPLHVISLDKLQPIPEWQMPHAEDLVRGIAARLVEFGASIPTGFDAYTTSDVIKGSGLSSSAAYEILIGTIFNALYCDNKWSSVQLAEIGQYAENVYYRKPCGLMDQMASSVGGAVAIDFYDKDNPDVHPIDFDFSKTDYALCIVDTGGNHADLTDEYAAIPKEMKQIASYFGKDVLSQVPEEEMKQSIPALRKAYGDRAVLRAMHFYQEDRRAVAEATALEADDFGTFLRLVNASGLSSYCLLQNVYAASNPAQQPAAIALAVGQETLAGRGALRIHGGGFGGTIQAFVPKDILPWFVDRMNQVLGSHHCREIQIRPVGGYIILD